MFKYLTLFSPINLPKMTVGLMIEMRNKMENHIFNSFSEEFLFLPANIIWN